MTTPEEHEWSRSAPGTEAFKQDYAAWQSLAADVAKALERAEGSVAGRLSSALAKDRLRAGGSERVPDAYRGARVEVLRVDCHDQEDNDLRQSASAVGPGGRRRAPRWSWRGWPTGTSRLRQRRRRVLSALRLATLLWLVVCLMRPMVRATERLPARRRRPDPRRHVAQHGPGRRRRRAPHRPRAHARRARSAAGAVAALSRRGAAVRRSRDGGGRRRRLTATDRRTGLGAALQAVRDRYRGRAVAGIVLITDGGDNGGVDAAASAAAGAPVYAIGIGAAGLRRAIAKSSA